VLCEYPKHKPKEDEGEEEPYSAAPAPRPSPHALAARGTSQVNTDTVKPANHPQVPGREHDEITIVYKFKEFQLRYPVGSLEKFVPPNAHTVGELRSACAFDTGSPLAGFRLVYAGQELEDNNATLAEVGIIHGARIQVLDCASAPADRSGGLHDRLERLYGDNNQELSRPQPSTSRHVGPIAVLAPADSSCSGWSPGPLSPSMSQSHENTDADQEDRWLKAYPRDQEPLSSKSLPSNIWPHHAASPLHSVSTQEEGYTSAHTRRGKDTGSEGNGPPDLGSSSSIANENENSYSQDGADDTSIAEVGVRR
jgi:hypothetical protein